MRPSSETGRMLYGLSSVELALLLFAIVLGTTLVGVLLGHRLRDHADALREPFGVLQGALLGLVALLLAFGLTMAVGRYDARRAAVVAQANAIGTTYLRAQTLREPIRSRSLDDLVRYTDSTIRLSDSVPGSPAELAAIATSENSSGPSGNPPVNRSRRHPRRAPLGSTSRPSTT